MSIYVQPTDIQTEFRNLNILSPASTLNATVLQTFCDETEARVTGVLARKFLTPFDPVINAQSFNVVKELCTYLVAGRGQEILRRNGMEVVNPNDLTRMKNLTTKGQNILDDIMLNKILLVDANRVVEIENTVESSHAPRIDKIQSGGVNEVNINLSSQPDSTNGRFFRKGDTMW
jgi:hypothetical protein